MSSAVVNGGGRPVIKAMSWLAAREVLGGEASDFTPWLAENLELLGDALGLAELTLVETESAVGEKRLDILAEGTENDGSVYPVIIENQYGVTDHKHLGQLVTYLAQQGRGLAVWIVESHSQAHSAAVEFLNRTSTPDVGYVLAKVRFSKAGPDEYQVDFEVLSRPNSFLRQTTRRLGGGSARPINHAKRGFLQEVLLHARPHLESAELRHIRMHARGAYIEMRLPSHLELDSWDTRLNIKVTRDRCSVSLHVAGFDTREENAAALDVLKQRYEVALSSILPNGTTLAWHDAAASSNSDSVAAALAGQGYVNGDSEVAAGWARAVCAAWAKALVADPIADLEARAQELVAIDDNTPDLDLE